MQEWQNLQHDNIALPELVFRVFKCTVGVATLIHRSQEPFGKLWGFACSLNLVLG